MQNVMRDGEIKQEPFYSFVCYMDCEIDRNKNQKIFGAFQASHEVSQAELGRGAVYGYSVRDFYASATKSLAANIYEWLNRPPETRPYRK